MAFDNCEHCKRSFPQDTGSSFHGDVYQYSICCTHCAEVELPRLEDYLQERRLQRQTQLK